MVLKYDWLSGHSNWIKGMMHAGYSRTKIYGIAKSQGWGIRKTDFLETMRYFQQVKTAARDAFRSTPLRYKPSDLKIPKFVGNLSKRYLIETVVMRKDTFTGNIASQTFRLGMDSMTSRGEIEDKIIEIGKRAGAKNSEPLYSNVNITKVEVFRSKSS